MRSDLLPLATLGTHISLAVALTALIGRIIFRSYLALPPPQAIRDREYARRSHVKLFSALAVVSLLSACYWGYAFISLSYRVWAAERGIQLPESIFGENGVFHGGEHPGRLRLDWFLNDTPIYYDALEIVSGKARYFWWGQQVDLATIAWGMLLDIEGRRRNIPHLWAFMTLAQIVNLSFAQNLFYTAMLLAPIPLPRNIRELTGLTTTSTPSAISNLKRRWDLTKAYNWCPHPIIYLIPLISSFAAVFLLPFASNTPSFMTVALASRGLCFAPLLLPSLVPEKWGTIHTHPHDFHCAYLRLFRTISIFSVLLHGQSTFTALAFNTPNSYYHRLHPFFQEQRGVIERGSTAINKLLGAIGDYPAVSTVGWDVLLSGVSLGLWATIRGLDVQTILFSCGLSQSGKSEPTADDASDSIVVEPRNAIEKVSPGTSPVKRRGPGRPRKTEQIANHEPITPTPRRRGRPRKPIESEADSEYEPTGIVQVEGDEPYDENWEIGALAWGLVAMTGLGTASASIFGAESTAW